MEQLNKETLTSYLKTVNILNVLAEEIFDYIKSNYEEYLEYGRYSSLDKWELDEDGMIIKYYDYGYDLYISSSKTIPTDALLNNTWKEFIDDYFNKLKAEKEANKAVSAAKEKENRKKLFEELKQEFGDGTMGI